MKALIATPTAGHMVTTGYAHSLIAATQALTELDFQYSHTIFDSADVVLARNYMANLALRNPDTSHLLFIDSDMLIETDVFRRLIRFDKPIAGCLYVERALDWDKYHAFLEAGHTPDQARAKTARFNVRVLGEQIEVVQGFCKVEGFGFGCVLIQRGLLRRLADSGIAPKIKNKRLQAELGWDYIYDFFGLLEGKDGESISEDYSFCRRARELESVDVWGMADAEIGHIGRHSYAASFLTRLQLP